MLMQIPDSRYHELVWVDQRVSDSDVPVDGDEEWVEEKRVSKCNIIAGQKSREVSPKVLATLRCDLLKKISYRVITSQKYNDEIQLL